MSDEKRILIGVDLIELKKELKSAINEQMQKSMQKLIMIFKDFEKAFIAKRNYEIVLRQKAKFIKGKKTTARLLDINIKTLNSRLEKGFYKKGIDYKISKNIFYFNKETILTELENG